MEEWCEFSDGILRMIISKEENRKNVMHALWSYGNKDFYQAKYLLFEIFSEFLVHPKVNDLFGRLQQKKISWNHAEFETIQNKFMEFDH
jgi:hypothetical protein